MSVFGNAFIISQIISGFIEPGREHLKCGIGKWTAYGAPADVSVSNCNDRFAFTGKVLKNYFII